MAARSKLPKEEIVCCPVIDRSYMRKLSSQEEDAIRRLFEVCKPIFEQWIRDDAWPEQVDSPKTEYLVESKDN